MAYQTLHQCLSTVALLGAPIAPFYMDRLYCDLNFNRVNGIKSVSLPTMPFIHFGDCEKPVDVKSVHLAFMPEYDEKLINPELEERMEYAQKISSMILALRRKIAIKVRQPLQKIMIPVLDLNSREQIEAVKNLILTEVNVKELEYVTDDSGILVKKIKPNYKT
jgi:isoleucyl-tRNA synthetase